MASATFDSQLVNDIMSANMAASFTSCSDATYDTNYVSICAGSGGRIDANITQSNYGSLSSSCYQDSSVISSISTQIVNDVSAVVSATTEGLLTRDTASSIISNIANHVTDENISQIMQSSMATMSSTNVVQQTCADGADNAIVVLNVDQSNSTDLVANTIQQNQQEQQTATDLANSISGQADASSKSGLSSLMDALAGLLGSVVFIVVAIIGIIIVVVVVVVIAGALKK